MKPIIEKTNLHPRNQHRLGYNFEELMATSPELQQYVSANKYNPEYSGETIDFSNPKAVKALNKALLNAHYDIQNWDIPDNGIIPEGENVQVLDIGIGANCIYPILGNSVYGWSFVGTEIDEKAIQNCKKIIENNPKLMDFISLQLQTESRFIFKNIITPEDRFSLTICNPPFHASAEEAKQASMKPVLNFGGQNAELWCEGGELGFVTQMIFESAKYPMQCLWFTTLVSKKENLSSLYKTLNKVNVVEIKTIDMAQGQKTSRILAWTFQSESQQKAWKF